MKAKAPQGGRRSCRQLKKAGQDYSGLTKAQKRMPIFKEGILTLAQAKAAQKKHAKERMAVSLALLQQREREEA